MQESYTTHYMKTYLWQGISIILNLFAMFVVVPKLSEFPSIYGVYSVIISFSIFFTYADMGFFSAGFKYASESYARNDLEEETAITGFVCFVLFVFIGLCAIVFFYLALFPQILIENLNNDSEIWIASCLLIILASFSPSIVFQRFLQIVYGVRIEGFINQSIQIGASLLKILSVFYFFRKGKYDIVGYYFFFQSMNMLACIISSIIVKKRYGYDYRLFLRSIRFSKDMYRKTKNLAFTSLYSTITHIIYYELDFIAIGKLLGAEKVAFYAIGFTLQSFVRSLFGTLYTPFLARFNHFIGQGDEDKMRGLLHAVIIVTLPFIVLPLISIIFLMKPLIYCWVGSSYELSIPVAQFLVLSFIYSFISYPAGSVLLAQEKIKLLYITGSVLPVVYWVGVAATIGKMGVNSFALNKFISHTAVNVIFLFFIIRLLKLSFFGFLQDIFGMLLLPCAFLTGILWYIEPLLPVLKSTFGLMVVISAGAASSLISVLIYAACSEPFRNYSKNILTKILIGQKLSDWNLRNI